MACQAANDQDIKTAMPIVCLYLQIDSMTNVGFWKSQIPISHWNPEFLILTWSQLSIYSMKVMIK